MSVPSAAYSVTASFFHWAVAIPTIGCVGCVMKAQDSPKSEKGKWMYRHKSLGLLTGMIVAPRLGYRLLSRSSYNVLELKGNSSAENFLGKAGHYLLYGFMTVMPATGIAMGYFGGAGLPFFFTKFSAIKKTDENKASTGAIAKNAFQVHKQLGVYGKYLIPVHASAAFLHYFRGQAIFTRVNPFRTPRG
uniref:Cytochrome b561 bacterial/Ni-hydrogenase domain-containing protein n=1 Tax=Entomoneis paludosa TaxID=265537 RepID=A0A7S2YPH7_9STRA|mmetsp:Transcript_4708/g.10046  ORF Transcript_4708/g.10046 Transcript_4708/m.10046 type:complete len:190 (+) Transcript_4708:99-668(+)|eukprot:CAMPEP_0172445440 /NCGR_PEP_ID=MMETSP1065-20121228/5263_1 /TAXON_ID=265537 /ORGANISM="Amphiprora paludosa, Strain CCMP125" /LENGTH=189 /DNA_ID=CAMNT_0013196277 /DNA_START=20 /DNA_END=589 /DNA_ORIENTATION=+